MRLKLIFGVITFNLLIFFSPFISKVAAFGEVTSFSQLNNNWINVSGIDFWLLNSNVSGAKPYAITNPDTNTLCFELRSGDVWPSDASGSNSQDVERSEISTGWKKYWPINKTVVFEYDFMVKPGSVNTANWMLMGQIHNDDTNLTGAKTPPLSVNFSGEKMYISGTVGTQLKTFWSDPNPIERGRWYHMVLETNNTYTPTASVAGGYVKVWRDNKQIVNYNGPIGRDLQIKFGYGIYRSPAVETTASCFKGLKIYTSPYILSGSPTNIPISKAGDINGDSKVDIIDIGILIDTYGKGVSSYPKSDVNNDGIINVNDIGLVIDNYGK